jgi:Lamin Tail Domain
MTKSLAFFGLFIFFVVNITTNPSLYAENTVFISELNYNGSSINGGDKWLELYNPTTSPISLNGWKLTMPKSSKTGLINLTGSIKSGQTYLVGIKNAKFTSNLSSSNISDYNITNISNTQPNETNYINVQLVNSNGAIVSQIVKNDTEVKNFGISSKGNTKHSIECDAQAICSVSDKTYGTTGIDYGTPGLVATPLIRNDTPTPIKEVVVTNIAVINTPVASSPVLQHSPQPAMSTTTAVQPSTASVQSVAKISSELVQTSTPLTINRTQLVKPVENLTIPTTSLPEFTFQSIQQPRSKTIDTSHISLEGQLLSVGFLSLLSLASKTRSKIVSLVQA